MKEFIFSEAEGHQIAIFIKKGVLAVGRGGGGGGGGGRGDAGVFSVLDRNTSLKNIF